MKADSSSKKNIFVYAFGNGLEWFDFIAYALLITTISKLFFPTDNLYLSMLFGFGTFCVTYIARPLGGLVFGAYADTKGRNFSLSASFILMAFATVGFAFLPTYSTMGVMAPVLLVVFRLLQGFSAGGEFGSATTALIESAPPGKKGLACSIQMCTQAFAVTTSATLIFALTLVLSEEDFISWGWRVPFIIGALLGPIGIYMRLRMKENSEFKIAKGDTENSLKDPVVKLAKGHMYVVFVAICLFTAITGPNYVNSVYLPSVAVEFHGLSRADAISAVLISSIVIGVFIPFFGWLSDRTSPRLVGGVGLIGVMLVYSIFYPYFLSYPSKESFRLLLLVYSVPYAALVGGGCFLAMSLFPTLVRATGGSISYNLATVFFGGMAPMWLLLVSIPLNHYGPLIYVLALSCLGGFGMYAKIDNDIKA